MYSGEYDACDVTLSVYPHRASLNINNMPDHGGNRTYDLWNTSPRPKKIYVGFRFPDPTYNRVQKLLRQAV